jgi:uncharacterized membrane protein HdeD (DUF308 family)
MARSCWTFFDEPGAACAQPKEYVMSTTRFLAGDVTRSWWVFLLYGIAAIAFGLAALFMPSQTLRFLLLGFGLLSLVDGVVSLLSMFRKDVALPSWVLALYGLISIGFGLWVLMRPEQFGTVFLWLLAVWLILAGFARVLFAVMIRKVVEGEWLLALSGLLAVALGIWIFINPNVGLLTIAIWLGIGALVYGALQIFVALRLRKLQKVVV